MPFPTLSHTENVILANCLLNIMVSITQTLAHIKSQEFIGYIKQHFVTTRPVVHNDLVLISYSSGKSVRSWCDGSSDRSFMV